MKNNVIPDPQFLRKRLEVLSFPAVAVNMQRIFGVRIPRLCERANQHSLILVPVQAPDADYLLAPFSFIGRPQKRFIGRPQKRGMNRIRQNDRLFPDRAPEIFRRAPRLKHNACGMCEQRLRAQFHTSAAVFACRHAAHRNDNRERPPYLLPFVICNCMLQTFRGRDRHQVVLAGKGKDQIR